MIDYRIQDKKTSYVPDLTALIDILFILIVFFLLTTNHPYRVLNLQLPKVQTGQSEQLKQVNFTLNLTNNAFFIEGRKVKSFEEFKNHIQKEIKKGNLKEKAIIVACSKNLPTEKFLKIINFLKQEKITNLQIITQNQ